MTEREREFTLAYARAIREGLLNLVKRLEELEKAYAQVEHVAPLTEGDIAKLPWTPFDESDPSRGWLWASASEKDSEEVVRIKQAINERIDKAGKAIFVGKYRIGRSSDGRFLHKSEVKRS